MPVAIVSTFLVTIVGANQVGAQQNCRMTSEGKICTGTQPLVAGDAVSVERQKELGLVTVAGGCSGTLLNRFWILTADHCVTTDGTVGGPANPPADIQITAAWSKQTAVATELVRFGTRPQRLDIALIGLRNADFGAVPIKLLFNSQVDTSMTLTKFGRGIHTYATGSGPSNAVASQSDGRFRTASFTPSQASATVITLPVNARGQVGNGGDSGGPDFVTGAGGAVLSIASVQSSCSSSGRVPGMPNMPRWTWVTGITSCNSAAVFTIKDEIQLVIRDTPRAPGSKDDRCISGYVWRDAVPGDHVCVTPAVRAQVRADNARAAERRTGPPVRLAACPFKGSCYRYDIPCKSGFVWRAATPADYVCVTPAERQQARSDNTSAARRRMDYQAVVR